MLYERSEEVIFEKEIFFLSTRAAEENVAGKIKLTAINSKLFSYQGYFFQTHLHGGSGGKYKLKAESGKLKAIIKKILGSLLFER